MVIGAKTIKRLISASIHTPVENSSVYFVKYTIEEIVRQSALEAEKLHLELNQNRKLQGLRERQRIGEEVFRKIYERIKYSQELNT